ncbi:uncharacterized protein LOC118510048 [Anopheles stephensi]|uniref:uncharacterized protein LOC118510048 n=1 Tax=Anopheles stephensi TaxID=30069 RepID=UPI0016588ADC|nr:uncharacterized protein LOC118510048 [Anopheles stephensi]
MSTVQFGFLCWLHLQNLCSILAAYTHKSQNAYSWVANTFRSVPAGASTTVRLHTEHAVRRVLKSALITAWHSSTVQHLQSNCRYISSTAAKELWDYSIKVVEIMPYSLEKTIPAIIGLVDSIIPLAR